MKPTTLGFPIDGNGNILLGRKRRGFGADKYNGFGGKVQDGEIFRDCMVRELFEEVSLVADPNHLDAVALFDFVFPAAPELTHIGYVYMISQYEGLPLMSEEMEPQWFAIRDIPYESMWKGDRVWLPELFKGHRLKGVITFADDNEAVDHMWLQPVETIAELEDEVLCKEWIYEGYSHE